MSMGLEVGDKPLANQHDGQRRDRYTQRECVAGSQNVIVQEQYMDEDTPGGPQHEGIDKKTNDRHTHRTHKKKKETPTEKKANEHSTMTAHLVPFVITEQTTRDQSLSDRSMSSSQPLSESWMCEQRTEGDSRTQQETAIYAIPRSGEDRSMSSPQPLSESWMCEQRTEGDPRTQQETAIHDIPRSGEDRSMSSSQPLSESWMCEQRLEGDPRTQQDTAIHDIPRSGDDHSKKHKHSKHHGVQHRRDILDNITASRKRRNTKIYSEKI